MGAIKPPLHEAYVGLEEYRSRGPGIAGSLKLEPEDFIVREITPEGLILDLESDVPGDMTPGDYTHFTLVKRGWDTMRALKELSKRVGVSRERFAFAGNKDKWALSAQRVSVRRVPIERLRQVRMSDIVLKDFTYSDENLGLGALSGNRFEIRVRGVCEGAAQRIESVANELAGGFPNYYGMQRFGDVRPITHEVGFHILKGDFESAVMTYVGKSFDAEDGATRVAREQLMKSRDFASALRDFPDTLGYEKSMLNHLIQNEGDWTGALATLPRNLQKMFVHAYQSRLYNRVLSECMRRNLSIETLPLVGSDVPPDDITARLLESDGIGVKDFDVPGMRALASRGEYREAYAVASDFRYKVEGQDAVFGFSLQKGSYATVFLREFMKN
jgi:tRNA pseudouridine13 synthase